MKGSLKLRRPTRDKKRDKALSLKGKENRQKTSTCLHLKTIFTDERIVHVGTWEFCLAEYKMVTYFDIKY